MIHLPKYANHQSQIIERMTSRIKYFLIDFRYDMKNRTIASNARTAIHARDRVEKIKSQNSIVGKI